MIKFISHAAVKEGQPFMVRCNCDGVLIADRASESLTCEWCGATITPEIVDNTESVSVQDSESGEWRSYHVQGYTGPRSPHTFQVGDKVLSLRNEHRWQIEQIEGGRAVVKMLGNDKKTGAPIGLHHRENFSLVELRYWPD